MIKNERQYRITKAQVDKFTEALADARNAAKHDRTTHPRLLKAQVDALESQLETLQRELREYDDLRNGRASPPRLDYVFDVGRDLIRARIAAGITQKDLAERLGVAEQQIQRYEATEYESASFARLAEVAEILNDVPTPSKHVTVTR